MRATCVLLSAVLASLPVWAAFHQWTGNGVAGRLDDSANWGINTTAFPSANFHDATKTCGGSENQCGYLPSGTYTIVGDTYFNRMVIDRSAQTVNFDLGNYTLYLVGIDGASLGATGGGCSSTYNVTSGTLCVPLSHNGAATSDGMGMAGFPRSSNASDSYLHDASLFAKGDTAVLDLKNAVLNWGTNNCIGAIDGGTLKAYKLTMEVGQKSKGNRWYFANGGKLKNPYANPTDAQASCNFAFSGMADGHRYEFANGGTQEGYERFKITGGTGFEVRFTGANTAVTFDTTNMNTTVVMDGTRNVLSALDGAKLMVTNSLGVGGRARIWINGSGNTILSSGAGSLIQFYNEGNLIGQSASSDHLVHATDYGEIRMANTQFSRGGNQGLKIPAMNNRLLVDNHGVFRDASTLVVGYGQYYTCCSNRADVLNGSLYANYITVGQETDGVDNAMDIGAEGRAIVADSVVIGDMGSRNTLDVHDGGKLSVGMNIVIGNRGGLTNRATLCRNALVTAGGCLVIGNKETNKASTSGNKLELLSGAEISSDSFVVYGSNNYVKVENARMCTTNEGNLATGIQIPWYNARDWNAHLVVAGTNPVLKTMSRAQAANSMYAFGIRRGAHVTFAIPNGGYLEPPLQAPNGRIGIFDDAIGHVPEIDFDLSQLNDGYVETVLTRSKELRITSLVMEELANKLRAAVTARFGEMTSCRIWTENNELHIRIGNKGMCMLFL